MAAISRYASALDGLKRRLTVDPRFVAIRNRDLADGQHRNSTENNDHFTSPGWLLQDFDARWKDDALRKDLVDTARILESEPAIIGVSAHFLGLGRKP